MKETALTSLHRTAGAKIVEYAGFAMPVEFQGVIRENLATRRVAGIFDVSHMGEFWISGRGALDLLQTITTNDVSRLIPGQAQYSCLPNGNGGIVDDLIVYRYEEYKYMLVVNAANIEKDWNWIKSQNQFNADMDNASDRMSLIALQGPEAESILQQITPVDLSGMKSFTFTIGEVAGQQDVIISATGYTGAGGFELYCYNDSAPAIWEACLLAGKDSGIERAGLAARDTLRLEMGYSLYGNDIDDTTSPLEAGLGWIVKMDKGVDFVDRHFYLTQKETGLKRKLVAFEMLDRGIPRTGYPIETTDSGPVGTVTSGTQSPTLNKGIGLGYISSEYAVTDQPILIRVRNRTLNAKIVKLPFIKQSR